jgi:predicted MFS family arabinose efflux permease
MDAQVQAPRLLVDDQLARRNAMVLAVAQALAGGNNTVILATGGILGAMLAPDKGLATLPISIYVLGLWFGALPFGWLSRRLGRRTAFQIGTACGVLTGLIGYVAVMRGSFLIFCMATFVSGLYASAHLAYRFAAADTATPEFRPKAISWVMIGGIVSGIVGPQVVIATKDLLPPYLFAITFLAQAALAAISAVVLLFLRIPVPPRQQPDGEGRPLMEIARQPRFIVAVACGVASYSMMNMVMTSAPLAMVMCNHTVGEATLGLQWHVLGMFVPSFFTGNLITRFGADRVVAAGLGMLVLSAIAGVTGLSLAHFWIGLVLLGVGWNFGFIGATTMVTECHRPNERNRVQSFNDFLVFGSMAIGSFSSGKLLDSFGWAAVNQVVFPVVLAAGALLAWGAIRRRPTAQSA